MLEHMYGKEPKSHDDALLWGLAALMESMGNLDYRESVGRRDGIEHMDDFFSGCQYGIMLAAQMVEAMKDKDNITYIDFLVTIADLAGLKDIPDDVRDLLK